MLHTLLKQSPFPGQVDVQKVVVVTPSSLLGQWASEIKKWCSFKLSCTVVDSQLGKATGKGDAAEQIKTFVTSAPAVCPLLIISYEACVRGHLIRSIDVAPLQCSHFGIHSLPLLHIRM